MASCSCGGRNCHVVTSAVSFVATFVCVFGCCWIAPDSKLATRVTRGGSVGAGDRNLNIVDGFGDVSDGFWRQPSWQAACCLVALAATVASRRRYASVRIARSALPAATETTGQRSAADVAGRRTLLIGGASVIAAPKPAIAEAPDAGGARLDALTLATLAKAKSKVFVVTGATAGVGLEAARNFVRNGGEVYVCGRTLQKAEAAVSEIVGPQSVPGKAIPVELDLSSFASVREFANKWKVEVKRPIDVFALNAGLALKQGLKPEEAPLSKDGYELTVATNHLGHFLLYNLLEDQLAPDARVVVTASSVHNPATGDPGAQATLGNLSGLGKPGLDGLMVDGGVYDSGKCYKDSKLCNVLFTIELARRLKARGSNITVNCLSPGLIPSKTFFRNQSSTFADIFSFASRNVLRIAETTEFGGDTLSFMALDSSFDGKSGLFYSAIPPGKHIFVEDTPSAEARDPAEAAKLWDISSKIVGV